MQFKLNLKTSTLSIMLLMSALTQAADLNLYNKDGRLFSDDEIAKMRAKEDKPLLGETS